MIHVATQVGGDLGDSQLLTVLREARFKVRLDHTPLEGRTINAVNFPGAGVTTASVSTTATML
jgi:hypothetical protein